MCGIVGIVANGGKVSPAMLEQATQSLAHRGPDDSGTVILRASNCEIGLGNRRLAILDLSSSGHQPMHDPSTGNWIVYNGEIYNFKEIRGELEKLGCSFLSNSDTEVVLKAFSHWGEDCLQQFRGMFAFAIWDARNDRLFLARDPIGIKPLYFASFRDTFVFASEVRTLLATGIVPRRLDRAGLLDYLTFGSLYDPNTLVEGVSNLRAGHYLLWENGHIDQIEYWDYAKTNQPEKQETGSQDRIRREEDLYASLLESVRMQMVSDAPVGLFLSGGIDSSALAAILSRYGLPLNTFSLVFQEEGFSEAAGSRQVAKLFGTHHHEIETTQQNALHSIPDALESMDLPTIDGINTYLISMYTRRAGMKVALSGLGGDEMFAGYSGFESALKMARFQRAFGQVLGKDVAKKALSSRLFSSDKNRKLATLISEDLLDPYIVSRTLFLPGQINDLISSLETAANRENAEIARYLQRANGMDSVNRLSYLEARCYMLNTLLRDADTMSMAHGLEVRVPLLDHTIADKLFRMPGAWKLNPNLPKPLLLGAIPSLLPEGLVRQKKRGFTLPFEHWLRQDLRGIVEKALTHIDRGPLAGVLSREAVWDVWQSFLAGKTSWSRPWSLYVLQHWCERHAIVA